MIREFRLKIDWLFWFIVLLPTFYLVGKDLRQVQMNFFQIGAMLLVGIMHVNRYVGIFLIWCLFQFVFFPRSPEQGIALQNVLCGALVYQFIVLFYKKEGFRKYLWAFFGILALNLLWCVRQMFQMDPIMSNSQPWNLNYFTEFPGFFGLPAFLGNYAAAILPLTFALNWFLFPLALAALFLSKSTFSVLAGLASCLFFFWFRKRIVFWGILLIGGIAFGTYAIKYDLPTGEFGRRLNCWKYVEQESFKTQFFGHGIGRYRDFIILEATPSHQFLTTWNPEEVLGFMASQATLNNKPELAEKIIQTKLINGRELQKNGMDMQVWEYVHNEFLQAFFETGLIGLAIICLYIWDIFRRFFEYGRKNLYALSFVSSFLAILIVSFGHFPFHLARLAGPFVVIMALLEIALLELTAKKEAII